MLCIRILDKMATITTAYSRIYADKIYQDFLKHISKSENCYDDGDENGNFPVVIWFNVGRKL